MVHKRRGCQKCPKNCPHCLWMTPYSNLDYWDQKCPHKSIAAMCQYDFWGVCCVRPWKRNTKTTTHQNASVNTRIKRTTKTATTQTWSTRMSNPICICQLFCQFRISPINSFVKSSLRLELLLPFFKGPKWHPFRKLELFIKGSY